jgi:hypothetical protein
MYLDAVGALQAFNVPADRDFREAVIECFAVVPAHAGIQQTQEPSPPGGRRGDAADQGSLGTRAW